MSGCWLWPGRIDVDGYGRLGHSMLAHRAMYAMVRGPIPDGLTLDHLCGVKRCVRPDHLEPVAQAINYGRYVALRTRCHKGHPFDDENTYRRKDGSRMCRTCNREASVRYRSKEKAA